MMLWWSRMDGEWLVCDPRVPPPTMPHEAWLPASPVGEDARKLALLECVPPGIEVPGVGVRSVIDTFVVEGT